LAQVILEPGESQGGLLRRFRKRVTWERILSKAPETGEAKAILEYTSWMWAEGALLGV
jgi:hypothetical protein